jgi:CHAT domain
VASCDSGNVGSPVVPGASVAHALHQAGIPLVVASQFPLSKEASVPLAAAFFEGVLWGRNALVLLQQLRAELHARYTSSWHDWASLVVYEALPQSIPDQLETLRYHQAKRAIQAVLERIDMAVQIGAESLTKDSLRELDERIESALGRLPLHGQYAAECIGIRASSRKRLAQAAFTARIEGWGEPYELLEEAYFDYERAANGLLVVDAGPAQRVATLHWVLVQVESLALVLGKESEEGRWTAARLSAQLYLDHPVMDERAWARQPGRIVSDPTWRSGLNRGAAKRLQRSRRPTRSRTGAPVSAAARVPGEVHAKPVPTVRGVVGNATIRGGLGGARSRAARIVASKTRRYRNR